MYVKITIRRYDCKRQQRTARLGGGGQDEDRRKGAQRQRKMSRMEKAPSMGVAQAVSDMMIRRSAGNLPKTRTIWEVKREVGCW